jgi:beta-fructofuranosidase
MPKTVRDYYARQQPVHFDKGYKTALPQTQSGSLQIEGPGSFRCVSAGWLPEMAMMEATAVFSESTKGFGIMLRGSEDFEAGYYARIEPLRGRLVFDAWPRRGDYPHMVELERPVRVQPGKAVRMTVYVDGTLCEVYLDDQVAMSTRMYDHRAGNWGLFVSEGCVEFSDVRFFTP